ncbi:DUF2750 domain-containing protein [Hymenobacter sp. HDW8]|uniref:DUF2750 domain-containing protein n=1 Tax=Hymenobacter sp. HDW8 TaxID=2714932 RepID=UPI001407EEED|nr:DUF2750 domain-containing protein [Hymenobacter sp. HDW8]QIL75074.1 DUF2750 domain-containing protein [Hymenobacter sp. HDW8]
MLQDASTTKYKHKKFVERVVEFDTVWALESEDGWATSSSNEFEDAEVFPFWSDRTYAKATAKEDWAHYNPSGMPLSDFLEDWLIGMYNDGILAGTNWDANAFGKENEPLDLALEIINELKAKNRNLSFRKFSSLEDYESQVHSLMDPE